MSRERLLLSGNEALARGAWQAGVCVAAGYPGTPSTEILETLERYPEVHAQWSPNEKVALEYAFGASLGGVRSLAAMKHVGLNVAADPLFAMAYTGVNAGLLIISADDPGMHSSQNEQDNRLLGEAAKVPVLEPADSQSALALSMEAFTLSERFDTPVLLRTTTRICHGKSLVHAAARESVAPKPYSKCVDKYVMLPSSARERRAKLGQRLNALRSYANETPLNRMVLNDPRLGIIASGVGAAYAREVAPEASLLTLMFTWPFPHELVRHFASQVEQLVVVEELEPFLENQVRAAGLACHGKDLVPATGELKPEILRACLAEVAAPDLVPRVRVPAPRPVTAGLPARAPLMCAGCSHRPVFHVLRKVRATVIGDIGCYTLGANEPLNAMDTCLCMGGSVSMAHGMAVAHALAQKPARLVAVLGDSTFIHSGITALIDVVYNRGSVTTIILDNGITAMTGHQVHPGSGETLAGQKTPPLNLEALGRAVGLTRVQCVDPYDLDQLERILREEMVAPEPSLIIARAPCALHVERHKTATRVARDKDACNDCQLCLRLGCPAVSLDPQERVEIDAAICTGCGLCVHVCKRGALRPGESTRAGVSWDQDPFPANR